MEQIAQDSLELIRKMVSGELTTEEKYLGMMELHKRYPRAGFYEVAQQFAKKWLKKEVEQVGVK